jgi:hypothetical protein
LSGRALWVGQRRRSPDRGVFSYPRQIAGQPGVFGADRPLETFTGAPRASNALRIGRSDPSSARFARERGAGTGRDHSSPLAYSGSVTPVGTPPVQAQPTPTISLEPTSAPAGGSLTVRGSGWTPGTQVVARLYQPDDLLGPGADLGGAVQVAQDGTFTLRGTVPLTLFGSGNRGNVEVTPGTYSVAVRQNTDGVATSIFTVVSVASAPTVPHDARYFGETRYRIDNDAIWGYFQARGGIETFGYPVSRTFPFLGCTTQIFQRQVAQVCADGQPRLINLLDPEIFPYTRVNGSTFPGVDDGLKAATPKVSDPTYPTAILDFVRANAPDVFGNLSVNFGRAFFSTVSPQMGGTSDPNILGLLDLEVWGAPISRPLADPKNPNFIYQRFQRGILHYDASTGVTHGILLADYLKSILTGQNVPTDLQQQASESRFYSQYAPGQPGWLARPGRTAWHRSEFRVRARLGACTREAVVLTASISFHRGFRTLDFGMLWLLPLVVIGGLLVTAVVLALLGWLGDITDRHQHAPAARRRVRPGQ